MSYIVNATGDLFPSVPGIASTGGVAMNAPPAAILGDIHGLIVSAMKDIPADGHGRFVGIATKNGGRTTVNLAVAAKHEFENGVEVKVTHWLGKTWGTPVGASLQTGVAGVIDF